MTRTLVLLLTLIVSAAAEPPRRIVSLSPNLTEMLYGVGAFGQLVGVSDYSSYPPEVTKLPVVGGWRNQNYEKLVALHPDLVFMDAAQAPFIEDKCKELGFKVMIADDRGIQAIYGAIVKIGQATGHEAEAAKLVQSTREGLLRVSRKTASLTKSKVVLIVDRTPGTLRDLYTATDGSFLAELVEMAGGHVATAPSKRGYAKLSKEDLLAINPDL